MSITSRVLEHVREHPGDVRRDIAAGSGFSERQTSNALNQLSGRRLVRCEFAGRFSRWYAEPERKHPVVSVFQMAERACL